MIDSTNPRIMADNIRKLSTMSGGTIVTANPEGASTGNLEKIGIGDAIYKINSEDEYSTTEKIVGKWLDGSPLYEKTISYTGEISTSYAKIAELGAAVDNVVFTAFSNTTSNGEFIVYQTGDRVYLRIEKSSGDVYVSSSSTWSTSTLFATIRYTKPASSSKSRKK